MTKQYFGYLRVSDDKYEQSIDNQEEIIRHTAERLGIDPDNIEFKTDKLSGNWDTTRPEFEEMLKLLFEDLEKNKNKMHKRQYRGIFCFKIDRLARNDKDFVRLFKLLDAWYSFYSATETIEDTPTGRLLFRMLCSFAIFESEKLSNRISLAQLHHLLQEKFVNLWGSTAIFWYEIKHHWKTKKEWEFVVDANQATVVQEIYDTYFRLTELHPNKKAPAYKTVYEQLSEPAKEIITQYRADRDQDTTKNIDDFISRIIKNDQMMWYSGLVTREIAINDELIKAYLEISLPQANSEFLITEGEGLIGTKMKFVFFIPKFTIVNEFLYDKVHHINSTHWEGKWNRYKRIYKGIFYKLLFFKNATDSEVEAYIEPIKLKRQYKKENYAPWVSFYKSEKKILDSIEASSFIPSLRPILDKHREEIEKELQPMVSAEYQTQIRQATGRINMYQHYVDKSLEDANLTSWEVKEYNIRMHEKYTELLNIWTQEKEKLQKDQVAIMKEYLLLFKVDEYPLRWDDEKFVFFHATLERIVYHLDKSGMTKIILYPHLFIQEYLKNEWINPILTLDI
jgi:hypothetical protein